MILLGEQRGPQHPDVARYVNFGVLFMLLLSPGFSVLHIFIHFMNMKGGFMLGT